MLIENNDCGLWELSLCQKMYIAVDIYVGMTIDIEIIAQGPNIGGLSRVFNNTLGKYGCVA